MVFFFFFKQKTAYEMRISDWSSDVCSSDLYHALIGDIAKQYQHAGRTWDDEDMKRILVDAFKHETKNDPDFVDLWANMGDLRLVPAIGRDGFVPLGEQTRRFPKKLAAALIERSAGHTSELQSLMRISYA